MSIEAITISDSYTNHDELVLLIGRANAERDMRSLPLSADEVPDNTALYQRLARPGSWLYVALAQEKAAGLALGYPESTTAEHLSFLMIEPTNWGQGVASRLLDTVAERARANNRQQVTLWTRKYNNQRARQLYEHKGYSLTSQTDMRMDGQYLQYALSV